MEMKDRTGMRFFANPKEETPISASVQIEGFNLTLLLVQTAACIIKETETMPTNEKPREGAGAVIPESFHWATHGFTNALQAQVEFLYAFVVRDCEKRFFSVDNDIRKFIARALSEYQKFKTRICEEEEKIHGKGFGSATVFYQIDWTDHNEKFLLIV